MLVQRMIADLVVRDEQIYELLQEIRVRDKAIDDLRNKLDKLKAKIDRLLS
jgi:peptidoglycan hydrolase CwlO-like protein